MLIVETNARIRREHFIEDKTIKEIARDLKVSRNTVRKVLRSGGTSSTSGWFSLGRSLLTDIDSQAWLADVLTSLPDHPRQAHSRTPPWNWRPQNAARAA